MKKLLLTLLIFSSSSHCIDNTLNKEVIEQERIKSSSYNTNDTSKVFLYAGLGMMVGGGIGFVTGGIGGGFAGSKIGGLTGNWIAKTFPSLGLNTVKTTTAGKIIGVISLGSGGAAAGKTIGALAGGTLGICMACD